MEREHPISLDACVGHTGVKELLPLRPIARYVDVQEGLPQLRVRSAAQVDRDRATVDGDRQLLARKMRRADVRSLPDVAEAHGIRRRAEVERPTEVDAVDRADDRAPVGGHGRQRQQAHPGQPIGDLLGVQPPLGADDAQQMRPGLVIAAVEQLLHGDEVLGGFVHDRIEPQTAFTTCLRLASPRCRQGTDADTWRCRGRLETGGDQLGKAVGQRGGRCQQPGDQGDPAFTHPEAWERTVEPGPGQVHHARRSDSHRP